MPLSIKHDEADRLARELVRLTGESLTEAVLVSLKERLERQRARRARRRLSDEIMEIGRRCASRPLRDTRPPDRIIGYDKHGLPA
jgi:antitoxin VapB